VVDRLDVFKYKMESVVFYAMSVRTFITLPELADFRCNFYGIASRSVIVLCYICIH